MQLDDCYFEKLKGDFKGKGKERTVYDVKNNPALVIKEGKGAPYTQNKTEWTVWQKVKKDEEKDNRLTEVKNLLGECFAISLSGKFLIMEKLEDVTNDEIRKKQPKHLANFSDQKVINYQGNDTIYGKNSAGEMKIRDYGLINEVLTNGKAIESFDYNDFRLTDFPLEDAEMSRIMDICNLE